MKIWVIIVAVLGLSALFASIFGSIAWAVEDDDAPRIGPAYFSNYDTPEGPPYLPDSEEESAKAEDDETALARMLASEDRRSYGARVVIAWITVQKAQHAGKSLFKVLTKGDGYGSQKRGSEAYYAATSKPPRPADRELAAAVLSGAVQPSAIIRSYGVGGWVERGQLAGQLGQDISRAEQDARLMEKQAFWGEGIYGQLEGTNWYLFSRKAPIRLEEESRAVKAAKDAGDAAALDRARTELSRLAPASLNQVPEIKAVD